METNPDHLKYMPHKGGESSETPGGEEPVGEVIIEEIIEERVEVTETPEPRDAKAPNPKEETPRLKDSEAEEKEEAEEVKAGGLLRFLYFLTNPLIVPTYACLLIFMLSILHLVAPGAALPYTLTVFGATAIVPFLTIYVMQKIGVVRSMDLEAPAERTVPYVIDFLALGAMAIFFICKGAYPWIWTIFLGGAATTLANFVINFRIRVSTHCSAAAAFLAVLIIINGNGLPQHSLFWWVIGALALIGVAGTGAVLIGKHKLADIFIGYATGFLGVILFSLIK
ncbi:MAG: hypothetical protein J1F07_02555 [Muribaculaceae bacterium]|nr:hypothetical protein [Muribaculaceae bacterium]